MPAGSSGKLMHSCDWWVCNDHKIPTDPYVEEKGGMRHFCNHFHQYVLPRLVAVVLLLLEPLVLALHRRVENNCC